MDTAKGKISKVLVFKFSRLSRRIKEFHEIVEYLEKYNVAVVSVTQLIDTSTPSGRLMRNILVDFDQYYSEELGEYIKTNKETMVSQGRWPGGIIPFGYMHDKNSKTIIPNPKTSKIVKKIFEMRKKGYGMVDIWNYLYNNNIKSPSGQKEWDKGSILYILRNPLYAGYIEYNGEIKKGQHEAIISEKTFKEVQEIVSRSAPCYTNLERKIHFLSSQIKCGKCGKTFYIRYNRGLRRYICQTRDKKTKKRCDSLLVDADSIEKYVENVILKLGNNPYTLEKLKAKYAKEMAIDIEPIKKEITELKKELIKYENASVELYDDFKIHNRISEAQFNKINKTYKFKIDNLHKKIKNLEEQIMIKNNAVNNIDILKNKIDIVTKSWNKLTQKEKNLAAKNIIKDLIIYDNYVVLNIFSYITKKIKPRIIRGTMYF